jgi:short-subunit dehydrogenase
VTVTALCPGPVSTGFSDAAGFDKEEFDNSLPRFMWLPAEEVARQAVVGLEKGAGVVIPGLANRLGAGLSTLVPKRLLVPILARNTPAMR